MNRAEYAAYLQSPAWRGKRDAVMHRCAGRCEDCAAIRRTDGFGLLAPAVHLHHLTYDRVGDENLDDLIGLCKRHHEIRHGLNEYENRERAAVQRRYEAIPEWVPNMDDDNPTLAEQLGVKAREIL